MPWKASSVMEERLRFVARLLDGEAMTDVCRDFGVSRKTGYKILDRYKEHRAGHRTGWLGRRDSNLCMSKSDLLNFIPSSTGSRRRSRAPLIRDSQVQVPRPRAESLGKFRF